MRTLLVALASLLGIDSLISLRRGLRLSDTQLPHGSHNLAAKLLIDKVAKKAISVAPPRAYHCRVFNDGVVIPKDECLEIVELLRVI